MTERKTKSKATTRSIARKTAKPASPKRSAPASSKSPVQSATKHDRIIAMLRTPAGATIASLVTATEYIDAGDPEVDIYGGILVHNCVFPAGRSVVLPYQFEMFCRTAGNCDDRLTYDLGILCARIT
jgi:hypothetical protein